jgi:hypothetical protein
MLLAAALKSSACEAGRRTLAFRALVARGVALRFQILASGPVLFPRAAPACGSDPRTHPVDAERGHTTGRAAHVIVHGGGFKAGPTQSGS